MPSELMTTAGRVGPTQPAIVACYVRLPRSETAAPNYYWSLG
ncbi:MAG TPA: hypothetical protein PLF56_06630 [Micropruina sp.]|nr:hypothetical protein [Micropruina sp.]